MSVFSFQAEDGIRDLVRSRGLGDVYKRQGEPPALDPPDPAAAGKRRHGGARYPVALHDPSLACLLYTSDAADERSSVDLGGRRIIKKTTHDETRGYAAVIYKSRNRDRSTTST